MTALRISRDQAKQLGLDAGKVAALQDLERWAREAAPRDVILTEYRFALDVGREWRFDLAVPRLALAIEYEGGAGRAKSRHTTVAGFAEDCEKYGVAAVLGWTVLRFPPKLIQDGTARLILEGVLRRELAKTGELPEQLARGESPRQRFRELYTEHHSNRKHRRQWGDLPRQQKAR